MVQISRWFEDFPWAKLAYSAILVAIVLLLMSELRRLWFDHRVYVGGFQVFAGSEEKKAQASAFATQLLSHHARLVHLFEAEDARRTAASKPRKAEGAALPREEATWWPKKVSLLGDQRGGLEGLELSVQGINVKEILTKLRQWVSAPNQIGGMVDVSEGAVRTTVMWPRGPSKLAGDGVDAKLMDIEAQPDLSSAAFHAACSLVWAQAGTGKDSKMAGVDRADFCHWTEAWTRYLDLRDRSIRIGGLSEADLKALETLSGYLDRESTRGSTYPEVYRLTADVIDLLPAEKKTPELIARAQEYRTKYTRLTDPTTRDLPPQMAKYEVLATARPAIAVRGGKLAGEISQTWSSILTPYERNVAAATRATGFVRPRAGSASAQRYGGLEFIGTAFLISENIAVTAAYILDDEQWLNDAEIVFGEEPGNQPGMRVVEVLYDEQAMNIAILRLAGHDVTAHPPLRVDGARLEDDAYAGRYVFAAGYPAHDARLPREFMKALLGGGEPILRVMPGRVVLARPMRGNVRELVSDMSTSGGTGGAPIVDLQTGRVIAMNYAGQWQPGLDRKQGQGVLFADLLTAPELPPRVREVLQAAAQ